MDTSYGVLLEAVSIQDYIFQSNFLKTNLGASHLIQHEIFDTHLKQAAAEIFGKEAIIEWDAWKRNISDIRIKQAPFEVGYIGGGNALLLVREKDRAEAVVKAWTRRLLIHAPGVVTAAAVGKIDMKLFRNSLDGLFKELRTAKSEYIPRTTLPRHGITAECRQSGLSAECWDKGENQYVSSALFPKINMADAARDHFQDTFKSELGENFRFPREFDKLGSIPGEDSHIAVVHIDGDRMGERFKHAVTLEAVRGLSVKVHQAVLDAFKELTADVADGYEEIMKESLNFDPHNKDKRYWCPMDEDYQKKCLPLTPVVLGGDDVTFVCDGRLGVYFAKKFIESFETGDAGDGGKLTASAGVAVIKTKYPFYRGYRLAEELCASAKQLNKDIEDRNKMVSALDFHIARAGMSGGLEQIREKHFQAPEGRLLYRPYKLVPADTGDDRSLDLMIELAAELKRNFPRSRIKSLQEILSLSKEAHRRFVSEIEFREKALPQMPGRTFHKDIFNNETIYYDMIELTEFYPRHELKKRGEQ